MVNFNACAYSSYGCIEFNRVTGIPKKIYGDGEKSYLDNIVKFDTLSHRMKHGKNPQDIDILDIGFWYRIENGIEYEPPIER